MKNFEPLKKALRIESERLYLKPITIEDTDTVLSFRNAEYVRNNFFYRKVITKEEHIDYFLNKCEKGLIFQFLVYLKETNEPIGCVYLQHYDEKNNSMESGLFFSENAPRKKGYATEAYKAMNDYAFKAFDLDFLNARVIATNEASMNLHKKSGFIEKERGFETVFPGNEKVLAVSFELSKRDEQ